MSTWTQSDVDNLKAAVREGVLRVSFTGPPARDITYQSLHEMRALLAEMVADVAAASGTRKPYKFAATRKGV